MPDEPNGLVPCRRAIETEHVSAEQPLAGDYTIMVSISQEPVGIWKLDRELRVLKVNSVVCEQLFENKESIIGKRFCELVSPVPEEKLLHVVEKGRLVSLERHNIKLLRQPDKSPDCWNMAVWPVTDTEERIIGACMSSSRAWQAPVEPVCDRDSLRDFVDTLVHDLKSPLTGTCMTLEALLKTTESSLDEGQKNTLRMLLRSNKETLELLQNLIGLNKLDLLIDGVKERLSLFDIVRQSCTGLVMFADCRGVDILERLPDEGGEIFGDAPALVRAFTNLISNAIKFTNSGGNVTLSCEERDGRITIHVSDTGIGIPAAEIPGLFQKYCQGSRGKRYIDGTGLGLYLSRRIVEEHGGFIQVRSIEGQGSIFSVSLPQAPLLDFGVGIS